MTNQPRSPNPNDRGGCAAITKIHTAGIVFVAAILLSGATLATPAFAELKSAEWLINGNSVITSTSVETSGRISMEDTSYRIAVICTWALDGSVKAKGEGETTQILNALGELITELGGSGTLALLCASGTTCEESSDIEVWPKGMPFHTTLYLSESGSFLNLIGKIGFEIQCLVLGILVTDECALENALGEVRNVTFGVEAQIFVLEPLGSCTLGGAGRFDVAPQGGNLETSSAGTLSASE
jgi:hypothetical protein